MMIRHLLLVVVVALCVTAGQARSTAAVNVVRELLNLLDNQVVAKRSCECPDWEAMEAEWETNAQTMTSWPAPCGETGTCFTCVNGNEIEPDWVNDAMDDCGDCSDELECGECESTSDWIPWMDDCYTEGMDFGSDMSMYYGSGDAEGEPAAAHCVCLAFAAIPWDDEDIAWTILEAIPHPCMQAMEADCQATVDVNGDLDWEDEAAVETAFVDTYGADAIAEAEAMGQEMMAEAEAGGMPGPGLAGGMPGPGLGPGAGHGPGQGPLPPHPGTTTRELKRRIGAMKRGIAAMKRGGKRGAQKRQGPPPPEAQKRQGK